MQYTLKKSLGQHFLNDVQICLQIKAALEDAPIDQLLEIGPGAGALTQHILDLPKQAFKAVELDREKVAYHLHTYPQLEGKLVNEDFLETAIPFEGQFTLVGNFPYNISTQIVFRVLDWKEQVPVMIGMFQKEVAERIAAKPHSKAYGILSVLTQAFYDVDYLFGQVSIDQAFVDWSGNCGNLTAAVGSFAISNGLVDADRIPENGICTVRIWQKNIQANAVRICCIGCYA